MAPQLFLTSPRNSAAAHQALFDRLKCRVLLTPEPTPPQALSIIETVSPQHLKVPSIDDLMKTEHRPYEYTKTYEQGRNDPLWIMCVFPDSLPSSSNSVLLQTYIWINRHTKAYGLDSRSRTETPGRRGTAST